jgi:hypothetical protein
MEDEVQKVKNKQSEPKEDRRNAKELWSMKGQSELSFHDCKANTQRKRDGAQVPHVLKKRLKRLFTLATRAKKTL